MNLTQLFIAALLPVIVVSAMVPEIALVRPIARWQMHWYHLLRYRCLSHDALVCDFAPTTGNNVTGRVIFTPALVGWHCGSRVLAKVSGLTSSRTHGFHIHNFGDISSKAGTATGGHFANPAMENIPHGLPNERPRHWGDLGNIHADKNGIAVYERVDLVIDLPFIIGRGMIVHALRDRGSSNQPTGGAGSRVAQCVIGIGNPDLI